MSDGTPSTLLLRLAGPLQSWGTSSRYSSRDTGAEPSKSGVVGILAASLGWRRDHDLTELAALRMGVRIDRAGVPGHDFQTAGGGGDDPGIAMARDTPQSVARRQRDFRSGKDTGKAAISISNRYFLQDAVFLVGLEGNDLALLHELDAALRQPVFPIGLGRRGYVPSCPVALAGGGVREGLALLEALSTELWPAAGPSPQTQRIVDLGLILEDATGGNIRSDQPVGAAFLTRVFGPRPVRPDRCSPPIRDSGDLWT